MSTFNPHLHFSGNTEEAFTFYKSVLGGEFSKILRYIDLPQSGEFTLPEVYLNKIMRIALPIGKGQFLLGADAFETAEQKLVFGDNSTISISAGSKTEADKLFNGLSNGGKIEMPIADGPLGYYFGMFADKFGVQWMIEFDPAANG